MRMIGAMFNKGHMSNGVIGDVVLPLKHPRILLHDEVLESFSSLENGVRLDSSEPHVSRCFVMKTLHGYSKISKP